MMIQTTRFGEIEVKEEQIYSFPSGILGFPDLNKFLIFAPKPGPFQWLQSIEMGSLAFVVSDPSLFFPDYRVSVRPPELESIQLSDVKMGVVLVILTVGKGGVSDITANLQGPLVFNSHSKLGKQLVLIDSGYTTKHPLVTE